MEAKGYEVYVLDMPDTENPKIDLWINKIKDEVQDKDKCSFIGHSIGCQAILRYLELDPMMNAKLFFVAPWTHLKGLDSDSELVAKQWLESDIDWNKLKDMNLNCRVIFSDNDPWVPISEKDVFESRIGARSEVVSGAGHFDDVCELPELLELF